MKPLSFSRPMVLARRAGRKTQTRRLATLPKEMKQPYLFAFIPERGEARFRCSDTGWDTVIQCRYGKPGDQLWVREDFQVLTLFNQDRKIAVRYLADGAERILPLTEPEHALLQARKFPFRATPGRFMYRPLARDLPTVTALRVERLQDITEEDAIAEGIERSPSGSNWLSYDKTRLIYESPRDSFRSLWESIHGRRYNNFQCDGCGKRFPSTSWTCCGIGFTEDPRASWEDNPWVWVISLTPFTPP